MKTSRFVPCIASLCIASLAASAQQSAQKPEPIPPQMEDIKTYEPPVSPVQAVDDGQADDAGAPVHEPLPAKSTARPVGSGFLTGLDRDQVFFDEPGDDRIWAAGDTFKASFGAEGATYVPFFGSSAPRNYPVHFALRSIRAGGEPIAFDASAMPVRAGDRIVFDRGIVDEVYDLTPTAIEQSFVIEAAMAGEIEIELDVETDLARSADDRGLVLASDIGSVRYGRAFAVDARAGKTEIGSCWNDGAIRLVVPAARVAAAAWPLVIDPVVFTFDVDDDTAVDSMPDVAFDASTGRCMAVYERVYSATDHDIYYRLFSSAGSGLALGYIDVTTTYWAMPKVANNNLSNMFLCVAEVGLPTGGARYIRGRTRSSSTSIGTQFTISGTELGEKVSPDVGGDPVLVGPTYFCVVYQRNYSSSDLDVLVRLVRPDSTIFGTTIFLANSGGTMDAGPSISKGNGPEPFSLQNWNIAWSRVGAVSNADMYGAQIRWDGAITTPPFAIDTTIQNTHSPSPSTSASDSQRSYLVAYQRGTGSTSTWGQVYRGSTLVDTVNLSALSGAPTAEDQWFPSADCDGSLFIVADQETYNGSITDYDIYASTFQLVGNQLVLAEGHRNLAFSATNERVVEVACAASAGGPPRMTMVIWQDITSTGVGDIEAARYDGSPFAQFCNPQYDGVIACPCGNAPTSFNRGCNNSAGTGGAALTGFGSISPDTVHLTAVGMNPSALCIFLQGNLFSATGVSFGDGVRCVTGFLIRLGTKQASGGVAGYPVSGDPTISARSAALGQPISLGQKRFYSVYYRDPASFACSGTFNLTNALQVQW